ncbi:hypothetical protein V8B55DRAFT_1362648, partial [Mucor lusitanicus]
MDHRAIALEVNGMKRGRSNTSDNSDQQDARRSKRGKENGDPGPSSSGLHGQQQQQVFPQQPTLSDSVALGKALKRVREKKPLSSNCVVPPDIMKLLNQPSESGVSILQYLAKDKNASRRLRESLIAIHRAKPRNGGTTVIINELTQRQQDDDSDDSGSSDYIHSSDDYSDDGSTIESSSYDHSSDEEDDLDTVIDYPFDLKKLMSSQPMRTMVSIGETLMIATVDTGAAISVMSRRLADALGLQLEKVNKRFALTGFNDAVSETTLVAKDVPLRIGGKLRREHFCVDNSIRDKDVCLLGRTWFTNHSITIDSKANMIIIPTGNGSRFIEVACMKDGDETLLGGGPDNDNVSTVPVYTVSLTVNQGQGGFSGSEGESSKKNHATLEEVLVGVPNVVQDVVRGNLNTFYEYAGLGRV